MTEQWHYIFRSHAGHPLISATHYASEELAIAATNGFTHNAFLGTWKLPQGEQ